MGRPSALLIMGGADYHNTVAHYELLAGLLAGPAGCNVTVTDDFPAQTEESLSRYDLLVLWATYGAPPREPVDALFRAVRQGTPLLGIHAAPYTVREIEGGRRPSAARTSSASRTSPTRRSRSTSWTTGTRSRPGCRTSSPRTSCIAWKTWDRT